MSGKKKAAKPRSSGAAKPRRQRIERFDIQIDGCSAIEHYLDRDQVFFVIDGFMRLIHHPQLRESGTYVKVRRLIFK